MKKYRTILIIIASLVVFVQLASIDYARWSWSNNVWNIVGIFSMVCIIISMILSNRYDRKVNKQMKDSNAER